MLKVIVSLSFIGFVASFCSRPVFAQDAKSLIEILKARSMAVQTLQADVRVIKRPGADTKSLAAAEKDFKQWAQIHLPDQPLKDLDQWIRALTSRFAHEERYFHYYYQTPNLLRAEETSEPTKPFSATDGRSRLFIFSGDRWQDYNRVRQGKDKQGNDKTGLTSTVSYQDRTQVPQFEIARGAAAFPNQIRMKLQNRDWAIRQLPWADLFPLLDLRRAVAVKVALPTGGPPIPLLQLENTAWKDAGRGTVRIRIWFDPTHGFMPIRLECLQLEPNRLTGEWFYVPTEVAEWSKPKALSIGSSFPLHCVQKFYQRFAPVVADRGPEDWPGKGYELAVMEYDFSKLRVNEPLDASLFRIDPAEGTNVVDEVSGVRYIVGSSGEQLRTLALDLRDAVRPPESDGNTARKTILKYVMICTVVLGGLIGAVYLRRRFLLKRTQ